MKPEIEPVIVFCSGEKAPLSTAFVRESISSTKFKVFAVFSIGLFALIQPYQPTILQRWEAITIIALSGVMVFAFYISALYFFAKFAKALRLKSLWTVWLLLLSSLMASLTGQWALSMSSALSKPVGETLLIWFFHIIMFAGLEFGFTTQVLPEILSRLRRRSRLTERTEQKEVTKPTKDSSMEVLTVSDPPIMISDKPFEVMKIRWAISEEHYLWIHTYDDDAKFVRGRMRDFLAQVPDGLGFAIHRSYWVSWQAMRQVEIEKNSVTVILDDNTSLAVARGRRNEFLETWKKRTD
jgi:hypothetical protein